MKWLSLRIGGRKVAVHIVRDAHPKLEGANGIYWPDECAIYLSRALAPGAREDTLLHELEHAITDISGAGTVLSTAVPPAMREDVEEQFVRTRTPVWHALLKDLGFVFPKGPHE